MEVILLVVSLHIINIEDIKNLGAMKFKAYVRHST